MKSKMKNICKYCCEKIIEPYNIILCRSCREIGYSKRENKYEGRLQDPWWEEWLLSKELFLTIHSTIAGVSKPASSMCDGTVFFFNSEQYCRVDVWMSDSEVIVAYPFLCGYATSQQEIAAISEFEIWIIDLRQGETLNLGQCRDRSRFERKTHREMGTTW
ncbi:hypothetical protein [Candidatus Uabimicrobium sp. HlEnr_7]|uniref:hypothetical protein n=1 Tax=Candidatus Uabimicrobium helgolandensis TaxID=3095367 RepID=UPI0035574E24